MGTIASYLLVLFFMVAGCTHFLNPEFYLGLIPPYLPYPKTLNALSGFLEVLLGLGILFKKTRKWSALGLLLLLVVFVPSHIYFIQMGSCVEHSLCIAPWISWVRLLVVHPLLIFWTWVVGFK